MPQTSRKAASQVWFRVVPPGANTASNSPEGLLGCGQPKVMQFDEVSARYGESSTVSSRTSNPTTASTRNTCAPRKS
jgi:hypothetical protein